MENADSINKLKTLGAKIKKLEADLKKIVPQYDDFAEAKLLQKRATSLVGTANELVKQAENATPDESETDESTPLDKKTTKQAWLSSPRTETRRDGFYAGRNRFGFDQLGGPAFVDTIYKVVEDFQQCKALGFFKVRIDKGPMELVDEKKLASSKVILQSQKGSHLKWLDDRGVQNACLVEPAGTDKVMRTFHPLPPNAEVLQYEEDMASVFDKLIHSVATAKKNRKPTDYAIGSDDSEVRKSMGLPGKPWVHCGSRLEETRATGSDGTKIGLEGIHTPYAYISNDGGSATALHVEDGLLGSVNIVLAGYPKLWLLVAPKDREDLEERILDTPALQDNGTFNCAQAVRHHSLLLSPSLLKRWKIPFRVMACRAGEMIVTLPGAYHQVINAGPNYAEAVNIAGSPEWSGAPTEYVFCGPGSCRLGGDPPLSAEDFTIKVVNNQMEVDRPVQPGSGGGDAPRNDNEQGGGGEGRAAGPGSGAAQGTNSNPGQGPDKNPNQQPIERNVSKESDPSDVFVVSRSLIAEKRVGTQTVFRLRKRSLSPSSSDEDEDDDQAKRARLEEDQDDRQENSTEESGTEETSIETSTEQNNTAQNSTVETRVVDEWAASSQTLTQQLAGSNLNTAALPHALASARALKLSWEKTLTALRFISDAAHPQQVAMARNIVAENPTQQAPTEAITTSKLANDQAILSELAARAGDSDLEKVRKSWDGSKCRVLYYIGFHQFVHEVKVLLAQISTESKKANKRIPGTLLSTPAVIVAAKEALRDRWGVPDGANAVGIGAVTIVEDKVVQDRANASKVGIDIARQESKDMRAQGKALLELLTADRNGAEVNLNLLLLFPLHDLPFTRLEGRTALERAGRVTMANLKQQPVALRKLVQEQLPLLRPDIVALGVDLSTALAQRRVEADGAGPSTALVRRSAVPTERPDVLGGEERRQLTWLSTVVQDEEEDENARPYVPLAGDDETPAEAWARQENQRLEFEFLQQQEEDDYDFDEE